jgi:hypothetical protein
MKHRHSTELFYKFLVHENVLFPYITNIRVHKPPYESIEKACDANLAKDYIMNTMDWAGSLEESKFWDRIHRRWLKELEKDREHYKQLNIRNKFHK